MDPFSPNSPKHALFGELTNHSRQMHHTPDHWPMSSPRFQVHLLRNTLVYPAAPKRPSPVLNSTSSFRVSRQNHCVFPPKRYCTLIGLFSLFLAQQPMRVVDFWREAKMGVFSILGPKRYPFGSRSIFHGWATHVTWTALAWLPWNIYAGHVE